MADAALIEVAVNLPVAGTFTYRVPRGQALPQLGVQVIVPFGSRTVTGFVIGHPTRAEEGPREIRDVIEILDEAPILGQEVLSLCRFAARYYFAGMGEVLRTALPQGERVAARRKVRLSQEGLRCVRQILAGQPDLRALALSTQERAILERLGKAGGGSSGRALGMRTLLAGEGGRAALERLHAGGLIEAGDEIELARRAPIMRVVVAREPESRGPNGDKSKIKRAPARAALHAKLSMTPEGLPIGALSERERALIPALVRLGLARIDERPMPTRAQEERDSLAPPPQLNPQQTEALSAIAGALGNGFATFLLHGITGSGKTEVYLHAIAAARARGRGALVLVPEIALTPQLAARFRARFGDDVAVLHSGLPQSERLDAWRRLATGQVGIALGARSAVFAPVPDLGIVVVDEEHDASFKQEEGVRYHGRDLALVRAQGAGAVAVLGSATPSLESYYNAKLGRYRLLRLPERAAPGASGRPLPRVEILDLRQRSTGPDGLFSPFLLDALRETVARGEQAILFLNRRGFSTLLLCRGCGYTARCRDCAVSLTLHRARERLVCHYCGHEERPPVFCPRCKATMESVGAGTERVEAVVRELLPEAKVARLDRDTVGQARGARGLEGILRRMAAHEIDILIGTQMVTKGHDFPGVTLVGVLQPDTALHLPDFRAAERTFQLLEQVAGRAGRAERKGRVIVQTYSPEHPAISYVVTHDYDGFSNLELELRREAGYPPFRRLAVVRIDAPSEKSAFLAGDAVVARLQANAGKSPGKRELAGLRILGPARAPLTRLRGRDRVQIWVSHASHSVLASVLKGLSDLKLPSDVRLVLDVDPQSVL